MAELAVTSALALIHELVTPLLISLNLSGDLLREIQSMEGWMRSMKAFIEDNDGREGNRRLRYQVEQFRDIAYEIEDVLEEFVLHSPHMIHNHTITRQAHNVGHNFKHWFPLRKTSDKIASIKKSIEDIKSQNAAFAAWSSSSKPGSSSGRRTGGNPYVCEIGSDSHMSVISKSLLPSYIDLSSDLKSCFLYFSIFPEDCSVERGRLVRLWVAERFAMGTDDNTAEEVAADYLNELIRRNLVHVSKWDVDGRPRNLRVLNLVHQFIIQKCKDENFAAILARGNTTSSNKIHRLSVHGDCTRLSQYINSVGIRSLLLFRCAAVPPCDIWKNSSGFQLSRLIDLQGAPLTEFPVDICRLTLLRYVCFRDTKITEVPKSIAKLPYLETLDLKHTDVTEIPKEISKLHKLRHLFAYKYVVPNYVDFDSVRGVKVHEGISNLTKLQNLSLVRVDQKGRIIKDLKKLSQLRKLGLLGLKREHGADLCEAINSMKMLTTLDLCSASKAEFMSLEQMSPPESLRRLYLKGRLASVPTWMCSLNNLLKIHLKWSKLKANPLNSLAPLPNLVEIHLVDCYIGVELVFEASKFKKLKILVIDDLSELHTIVIQEGSMPDLEEMSLRRCPKMVMLPLGMDSLSKVIELVLHDMADEFVARVKPRGDDRWMVEHIPVVHSFTLKNRSWSLENLSSSVYHREVASADARNSC